MLSKYLLSYLITGTRGGGTRYKILLALKRPMNMHKLSKHLKLDYKTVQHHLRVLEENHAISVIKKGSYGAMYHLSPEMEENFHLLREMV